MTRNEEGPDNEELKFLSDLKKSSLHDYPNPERVGCPGREFLRTLAVNRKSVLASDPRSKHVIYCSPCFQEFTELGERMGQRRRQLKLFVALAAMLLVAVSVVWTWKRLSANSPAIPQIAATISLQNRSVARGDASPQKDNEILRLPRGHLSLTILLPFTSPEGVYDVQLLKEVDRPLISRSGRAVLVEGNTRLSVDLNTSALAVGKYLLGVRHAPLEWSFNPVTVE